jgi:hypothetical protein
MKNLLLLSFVTIPAALGSPCTTAVGSAHVFATCALGDRTFSAFAPVAGVPGRIDAGFQDSMNGTNVLVPYARWTEATDQRAAVSTLTRVDSATPDRADHGLQTAITAVGGTRGGFREFLTGGASDTIGNAARNVIEGVVLSESDLVSLKPEHDGPGVEDDDSKDQLPIVVVPPELTEEEENAGGESETPILLPDLNGPGDRIVETPEPATYASIGAGLIGLWILGRRARTADKS